MSGSRVLDNLSGKDFLDNLRVSGFLNNLIGNVGIVYFGNVGNIAI